MNKLIRNNKIKDIVIILIIIAVILSPITATANHEDGKINYDIISENIFKKSEPLFESNKCDRDSLFFQRPYLPDEDWEFYTSDSNAGFLCVDDFYDVDENICNVQWWGLSLYWNGNNWLSCNPVGMDFEIVFYDSPPPGDEVYTFSNLYPTYTYTGLQYSGFDLYHFETDLSPCIDMTDGWVSIQSTSSPNNCWFRWSGSPDNDDNALQNGESIEDSLAFKLTGGIPYEIEIGQIDFYLDNNILYDSSWGTASITCESIEDILFFNLAIDELWVVKNFPILPIFDEFVIDFNLHVPNGKNVPDLEYACKLTQEEIIDIPSNYELYWDVETVNVLMCSGEKDENGIIYPMADIVGGAIIDSVWLDPCFLFNQPQGKYECVPASISNNLKFLREKYNLNLDDSDISIGTMKIATDWDDGCTFGWWNNLENFMEDNNYRIGTRLYSPPFNIDEIMQELSLGNGVELRACGHLATIVGIIKFSDGKYQFAIVHDTYQGPSGNGGEELQFTIYDPVTNKFSGGKWINGRTLSRFVVEYPINDDPSNPYIDGPSNGKAGENYTYTFVSKDPDNDNLYYEIDWGDGNIEPWDGPYPSNAIVTKTYNWIGDGTYIIKARAKDDYGGISDWNTFKVNIPRGKTHSNRLLIDIFARFPFILKIFALCF